MNISQVSNSAAAYNSQPVQTPAKTPTTSQPADTVHLSPAAQAQVSGGDVDHDGDSH